MGRLLIFIAGGIAGYLAGGWLEGFCEKKTAPPAQAEPESKEA